MTNGTFLMMSFDLEILFCPQTYGLRFPSHNFRAIKAGSPSGLPPCFRAVRYCTPLGVQALL